MESTTSDAGAVRSNGEHMDEVIVVVRDTSTVCRFRARVLVTSALSLPKDADPTGAVVLIPLSVPRVAPSLVPVTDHPRTCRFGQELLLL